MAKIPHMMAACFVAMFIVSTQASAAPMMGQSIVVDVHVIPVAGGCGPNGWRGPYGGCRYTPYYGPLPGGYYQEAPVMGNGCPPVTGAVRGGTVATWLISATSRAVAGSHKPNVALRRTSQRTIRLSIC